MPVAITIRNVPEAVRDEYAARAASAGMSMQEYLLRELSEGAVHVHPRDVMAEWASQVAEYGTKLDRETILGDLGRDRP